MKKTLKVKDQVTFDAYGTKLHYSVAEDARGCGYYLAHMGSTNNRKIFEALGIDSCRHEFVKKIVGNDYSSGNGSTTQFPVCTTLEALTKVVNALIKKCEGESDDVDLDTADVEPVESVSKVVIRAVTRVKVNLK